MRITFGLSLDWRWQTSVAAVAAAAATAAEAAEECERNKNAFKTNTTCLICLFN